MAGLHHASGETRDCMFQRVEYLAHLSRQWARFGRPHRAVVPCIGTYGAMLADRVADLPFFQKRRSVIIAVADLADQLGQFREVGENRTLEFEIMKKKKTWK